ncbi:unnamed protein product [Sphagnum jensenii]|uniref:Uncharacterized protein n=1 Tax=Sphagnum jensenii TaxID=128206 RepID=A0ABP0VLD6_9BRYO
MKTAKALLLLLMAGLVIWQAGAPRHIDQKALYARGPMDFTPLIVDLKVPDAVSSQASEWYTDLDGSGLSVLMPDGYKALPDFCTFARDRDTSINITEDHGEGFPDYSKTIDRELACLSQSYPQDVTLLYRKNFVF